MVGFHLRPWTCLVSQPKLQWQIRNNSTGRCKPCTLRKNNRYLSLHLCRWSGIWSGMWSGIWSGKGFSFCTFNMYVSPGKTDIVYLYDLRYIKWTIISVYSKRYRQKVQKVCTCDREKSVFFVKGHYTMFSFVCCWISVK